jgi:hypothetical protein
VKRSNFIWTGCARMAILFLRQARCASMSRFRPKEKMRSDDHKQREFFELAERFRASSDSKEVNCLGDELGRMVFGSCLRPRYITPGSVSDDSC